MAAQNDLGCLFYNDSSPVYNPKLAASCFEQAASHGLPIAQGNLARCYQDGHGVPKNAENAIHWHTKAAEQGHEFSVRFLRNLKKVKKITILRKNVIFEAETVTVRKRQFGSVTHTTTYSSQNGYDSSFSWSSRTDTTDIRFIDENENERAAAVAFDFKCQQGDKVELVYAGYDKAKYRYLMATFNHNSPRFIQLNKPVIFTFSKPSWPKLVLYLVLLMIYAIVGFGVYTETGESDTVGFSFLFPAAFVVLVWSIKIILFRILLKIRLKSFARSLRHL